MWWRVNTYLGQDYMGILCSPYNFSRGLKSFQKKKILTVSIQRLSDFIFTFHFHALEKEVVTHSTVLAWRIPGTGDPGGLPSMGSRRVGHNWSDLAAAAVAAVYMFRFYFLKSSHCFLLPLSTKVCSLCLCLLSCSVHRILGTIFLDSVYMR